MTVHLLLGWPVPVVQANVGHRSHDVTYAYVRDLEHLVVGKALKDFKDEATTCGFESY